METTETKRLEAAISETIDNGELVMLPWGADGRLDPELLIDFFEDITGTKITSVRSSVIRDMAEKEHNLVFEPNEMVSLLVNNERRLMPKPLLYSFIDGQVNRWRRRRGYVDKVDGVEVLRKLVLDKYGSDIQIGSLEELQAMLVTVNAL